MKRCTSILVVVLTIAGLGTSLVSGGRVLCVGPDQHEAVEFRHATCPESSGHGHDENSDSDKDCVDFELAHDLGDHSSRGVSVVDHSFAWAAIFVPAVNVLCDVAFEPATPPDEGPPGGVWRCVRNVVLLI